VPSEPRLQPAPLWQTLPELNECRQCKLSHGCVLMLVLSSSLATDDFTLTASMYFLALSQAPPVLDMDTAICTPLTSAPDSTPAKGRWAGGAGWVLSTGPQQQVAQPAHPNSNMRSKHAQQTCQFAVQVQDPTA